MCGIAGWANLDANKASQNMSEAVLHQMCERMKHRGPDSEGLWLDESVALGMRRLSIIDLHTGEQPVYSEDKSIVVVMNGELYNFREARNDLEKRGHRFETQTDTEILPHLYEEYGEAMLEHINGMFAFALWDKRKKKILIARDRFGEKPLYYGVFDGALVFASEPKVLLEHPSVKTEINPDALRSFLSFDYVPAPASIYKGISKLPAAHLLILEKGEVKTRRYWNLTFHKNGSTPGVEKAATDLRELLADAVRMRLVSDVPLGILLSGGVDSSTVAAFATQFSTERVKTFSIGFEEDSFDESKFAREVATHLGTEHYEDKLSVERAADLISEIGMWLDEPMSDGSLLPTFLLSRFVKKYVTVALGGDGGDEIFAGYPMYFGHKMARVYNAIPRILRAGVIEPIVNNLPVSTKNLSFDYKAKRFVAASKYDVVTRHHSWFGSFSIDQQNDLLKKNVLADTSGDIYKGAKDLLKITDAPTEIEQMQFLDMNFYMAEDILTKVDRASMAVSLEVRAPFLDPRVAQFAASLPLEYKLRGNKGKYILKKAVEPLLPKSILQRPKKGFGIPIAGWLKGRLNPLMHDLLAPERLKNQGLFNEKFVRKLIREHETNVASHHKQLWTLLVFQLWFDNFMKKF
ncbi:MAG: asparagine synthase (glutamine-hydrolyzing) [Acidobacteria bacterium]|jgi:asparagine synthase (glutamine-hydrolysing)|nr:asparagine synthase (glutamine-hydrolyzing) [Acidobacteriota bacterium]